MPLYFGRQRTGCYALALLGSSSSSSRLIRCAYQVVGMATGFTRGTSGCRKPVAAVTTAVLSWHEVAAALRCTSAQYAQTQHLCAQRAFSTLMSWQWLPRRQLPLRQMRAESHEVTCKMILLVRMHATTTGCSRKQLLLPSAIRAGNSTPEPNRTHRIGLSRCTASYRRVQTASKLKVVIH